MSITRRSRLSIWWWEMSYRVGPNLWVAPVLMSAGSIGLFGVTRWMDRNLTGQRAGLPALLVPDTTGDAAIVLVALLGAIATALALVFSTSSTRTSRRCRDPPTRPRHTRWSPQHSSTVRCWAPPAPATSS